MSNLNFIFFALNEMPKWFDDKMAISFAKYLTKRNLEATRILKKENNMLFIEVVNTINPRKRYVLSITYVGLPIYKYSFKIERIN